MLIRFQPPTLKKEVVLRGYSRPELRIDKMVFKLSQSVNRPVGIHLYANLTDIVFEQLFYGSGDQAHAYEVIFNAADDIPITLKTDLKEGEVVMAVAIFGKDHFKVAQSVTSSDGHLNLRFLNRPLQFVNTPVDLASQTNKPVPVLLVKLTNTPLQNLKAGIFLPYLISGLPPSTEAGMLGA